MGKILFLMSCGFILAKTSPTNVSSSNTSSSPTNSQGASPGRGRLRPRDWIVILIYLEVDKLHFNYNIAFVFSLPEYQGLRDQPNFAWQINNFTATIGEDIVLKCRVKNVTSHRVNKYMYFIMEYCLLILRLISQVDWMLLDYRSFLSTLELLQGRGSILTMGNFKMTFNARIDIDHEEDTSSGTR